MKRIGLARVTLCLVVLGLALAGCASSRGGPAQPTPTATTAVDDVVRRDAEAMAEMFGISIEEAIRRGDLQGAIGDLNAALEQREADTFAGLWIQNEPEYRVFAAFTRDGEETIRRYVKNTSLAGLIEVRKADVTLVELNAIQQQVMQLVQDLGFPFSMAGDIPGNRVELWVTDQAQFEAALRDANRKLPEHVKMVVAYEPLEKAPVDITPVAGVAFPQLRAHTSVDLLMDLPGKLLVENGCLRITTSDQETGYLVIWQPDYFLNDNQGAVEVWDREGKVVGRVGETITLGLGGTPGTGEVEPYLREPLPAHCPGPYWLMSRIVPGAGLP